MKRVAKNSSGRKVVPAVTERQNSTFLYFGQRLRFRCQESSDFVLHRESQPFLSVSCLSGIPSAVTGSHSSEIPYVNGYHNSCETRTRKDETYEKGKKRKKESKREWEREREPESGGQIRTLTELFQIVLLPTARTYGAAAIANSV